MTPFGKTRPPSTIRFDRRRLLAALAGGALASLAPVQCRELEAAPLDDAVARAFAEYRHKLDALVAWCRENGLEDEARRVLENVQPYDPEHIYLTALDRNTNPKPPENPSDPVREWFRKWMSLRRDQADKLFTLAQSAAKQGRMALALNLTLAAVHENPDHSAIRRLLGYTRYGDDWKTAFEAQKSRQGEVWDDRFGWIPKSYLNLYEQGQRRVGRQWVSAEDEARLRSDIRNGWVVETEHYHVLTNVSLEAAARLAKQLEKLYQVWSQLFVGFYATRAQVAAMFEGRLPRRTAAVRHQVIYYRSRDEYVQALRPRFPQIEVSVGIYVGETRTAYFYDRDSADRTTLFHEATHQLFSEMRKPANTIGRRGNFWIIEGVAMYMETLKEQGPFYVLGDPRNNRMIAAQYRYQVDRFYIPLADFCRMTMQQFQTDERIAVLYSQAAGLTHFLMHYDGGKYRDAVALYLNDVYAGRDVPETLARYCGTRFDELDRQYAEYIASLPPLPQGLRVG
ncbi:hypothetical protein JCM19992_02030 [Thermostilla marina]